MDKAIRAALLTAKRKDNASENIADYVADLLRQGRAKEITDDLMEQADPQRLMHHYKSGNTGMDLPMDYASRMARAAQMGLTENTIHGTATGKDFSAFKGADRYGSRLGQENYVAPNTEEGRKLAAQFSTSEQGRIMPLFTPKPLDTRNPDDRARFEQMMDEKNRLDDFRMSGGYSSSGLPSWGKQWAIDTANEAGVPAMKLHERDWVTSDAVFDPTKMRSQFARFDPRLEHLAHLSASTGGAMDFARHVEAVHRAGGQIAPSKYLPDVPRQVHAGGGKVAFMQGNHPDVPDVVYHNTNKDFSVFDPSKSSTGAAFGPGIYLSEEKEGSSGWSWGEGNNVMPLHVSIKNPINIRKPLLKHEAEALNRIGLVSAKEGNPAPLLSMERKFGSVSEAAQAAGFDGLLHYGPSEKKHILAFDPHQIKSATGNQGTFDPSDPDITKANGGRIHANGGGTMDLRSKAAQVVRDQPQAKGNVDQMLAMMVAKGVKPSELLNAGRPFGHSVSKEELAQHFEEAVPKVGVTKYGAKPLSDDEKKEYQELGVKHEKGNLFGNEARRFFDLNDKVTGNTQYSEYLLPGGENYREHVLHLPKGNVEPFYSNHWREPNALAHVRMDDRDNGKTLHVQEVQSDWGQEGRKKGFYDPMKPIEVFHTGTGQTVHATDDMGEAKSTAEKLGPEYDYGHQGDDKVPQGPYVGNTQQWTDLAVKHALTEAARGGHDRVVFSPGEANADINGQRTPISSASLYVPLGMTDALGDLYTHDRDSGASFDPIHIKDEKELVNQLGRKHAKALLSQEPTTFGGTSSRTISEPDMHLGGHGMVDYYNNIVHPAALKLLRQHDPSIQPESYDLPSGYKGFSLPMTDTARQSILKNGFQAFKRGGKVDDDEDGITAYHGSPHSFDQFDISKLGTGEGAQAYGHGLYFAGNEKIAKHYRDMLAPRVSGNSALQTHNGDIDAAIAEANQRISHYEAMEPSRTRDGLLQINKQKLLDLTSRKAGNGPLSGHMYKVKLNVKPSELLDWDKPLSEQPEVARKLGYASHEDINQRQNDLQSKMRPIDMDKFYEPETHVLTPEEEQAHIEAGPPLEHWGNMTGKDFHDRLVAHTGSKKGAADAMQAAGLKGIRYLDASSRGNDTDGDPTHNYVMFHHDPVQVTDKYEYGGTVAIPKAHDVSAALALTRRFTKDGIGATVALKSKGK